MLLTRLHYHLIALIVLMGVLVIPALVLAQIPDRLVPASCTGPNCTFCDLLLLAQNILNFAVYLAVVLAAVAFAYAGGLYLTSSQNPEHISRARSMFRSIAIGIIIILAAWLVIDTLLAGLLKIDLGALNAGCRL